MLRLPGFKYQRLEDYRGTTPGFDIRTHLAGEMLSEGVIYGPSGKVVSRFVADMYGEWDGAQGTLSEAFRYATGETQDRKWFLTERNNGTITATADDIIGEGHGAAEGAMFRMGYRLKLSKAAGGHVLNVIDWMYLMENGTIMNRSQMFKFGVKVAELVATIRPVSAQSQEAS